MTGGGIRLGGSAVDRAGGRLRLVALADRLVHRRYRVVADETATAFRIVVVDETTGELILTLYRVPIGRSAAVRGDQARQMIDDRREVENLLAAEVRLVTGQPKGAHL